MCKQEPGDAATTVLSGEVADGPLLALPSPAALNTILARISPVSSSASIQLSICGAEYARLYGRLGNSLEGELAYRTWFKQVLSILAQESGHQQADTNRRMFAEAVWPPELAALRSVLGPGGPSAQTTPAEARQRRLQAMLLTRRAERARERGGGNGPALVAPLFIVSPPRSGSTLLFEALKSHPELWSIGGEAHELVETIPGLHPAEHGWESNVLCSQDATEERIAKLHQRFGAEVVDHEGVAWRELAEEARPERIRLLEKTPKNALRIGFWHRVFPDARFLFLVRKAAPTLSSMLACWRSERFVAYPELPGWPYGAWSLLLPPGWPTLVNKRLAQIVACQWQAAVGAICDDLETLPSSLWHAVSFERLIEDPRTVLSEIAAFAGLSPEPLLKRVQNNGLPLSGMVQSLPDSQKWLRDEPELRCCLESLLPLEQRAYKHCRTGPDSSF